MRHLILLTLSFLFVTCQSVHQGMWQANPEIVMQNEDDRPEYIWSEDHVPEYELPDPLLLPDGSSIQSVSSWEQNRHRILDLFRSEMYGRMPGLPDSLTFHLIEEDESAMNGTATMRRVSIRSVVQDREHEFELILFLPNQKPEPVPVFLLMNNRAAGNTDPTRQEVSGFWPAEEVIERGYGVAAFQNQDLAPDDSERYHEGVIRLFEGGAAEGERPPDAWMAISAWGWGAGRVMDYFETVDRIDSSKIALLGHSRGGKAALWAGAEDERFALVISNDSGSGGAALSRRAFGETIEAVDRFTHWFAGNFGKYNDREEDLPFDQHMLLALMAPRAVYVASADEDLWADPRGEFLSLVHSSPVYNLWGYQPIDPDSMPELNQPLNIGPRGYHVRSGGHNLTPQDWHYYMDFAAQLW